jgi:uncharacterized protein (TIGR03083 family)
MHFPAPYASRASMLEVMRAEHERFFDMVSNPDDWLAESRLPDWQVRDLVAHMIDETERYLDRWKMARGGQLPKSPGLADFREELKAGVLALRELPREEAIARLRAGAHATVVNFEALTEEEWSGFQVAHGFLGPLPASFFVPLELGHHALHAWDLGLGDRDAKLDERSAGILVTQYIFNLWDYMFDAEAAKGVHIRYGIKIDGDCGGQWIVAVNDAEWAIEEADDLRDVQAVVRYRHPSDMVLSSYFRIEAGEVSGEPGVIDTGRRLFSRPV